MRIAIVNDLRMAAHLLSTLVEKFGGHTIAWIANNGEEAVALALQDPPDLILMDLIMPLMGGVEATRRIMQEHPCAVLVVTSSIEGNLNEVFEAMGYGALDVVKTPPLEVDGISEGGALLLDKIERIGILIGKMKHHRLLLKSGGESQEPEWLLQPEEGVLPPLFVVGASTGGPTALAALFSQMPAAAPFAIVAIQHVDQEFSSGIVSWLSEHTPMKVLTAEHGKTPRSGNIYLPDKKAHLMIGADRRFHYYAGGNDRAYKPSIDVLFESVAKHWPHPGVAALLTGMGSDGAQGLKLLRQKGWYTLAESRSSCVVYGMPKAAMQLGAVDKEVEIQEMASLLLNKIGKAAV